MNNQNFTMLTKIVGVVFVVFGILQALACLGFLTVLVSGGVAGNLANQAGANIGSLPMASIGLWALITAGLAVVYFLSAYGLLTSKPWAYKTVALVAGLSLVSGLATTMMFGLGLDVVPFVWAVVWGAFAYVLYLQAMGKPMPFMNMGQTPSNPTQTPPAQS